MYYFVTFTADFSCKQGEAEDSLMKAFDEIGLRRFIQSEEGTLIELPPHTWIGEYDIEDKDELKNLLYTEVLRIFRQNGLTGKIFIAVSEKAVVGTTEIPPADATKYPHEKK